MSQKFHLRLQLQPLWILQGKEQQFSQRAVPVKWECKIPAPRAAAGEGKLAPAPHGAFFFFFIYIIAFYL